MTNTRPPRASLEDLAVFVAVAETGGFSTAAERLRVSKAMVSVAVARLERQLGVQLLHRTTRRTSLTEAGAATLPHAQRSLLAARDAEEAATAALASPRGLLRVHAPTVFGLLHVAPHVADFARAHPEVQLELSLDEGDAATFDVAIGAGEGAVLASAQRVLVASPAYLSRGVPTTPIELTRYVGLVHERANPTWILTRGDRRETVTVRGPLASSNDLALYTAALEGLGIAALPVFVVGADLAAKRLLRVLPDWELPTSSLVVRTAKDHRPAQAFVEFLRARLGSAPT